MKCEGSEAKTRAEGGTCRGPGVLPAAFLLVLSILLILVLESSVFIAIDPFSLFFIYKTSFVDS